MEKELIWPHTEKSYIDAIKKYGVEKFPLFWYYEGYQELEWNNKASGTNYTFQDPIILEFEKEYKKFLTEEIIREEKKKIKENLEKFLEGIEKHFSNFKVWFFDLKDKKSSEISEDTIFDSHFELEDIFQSYDLIQLSFRILEENPLSDYQNKILTDSYRFFLENTKRIYDIWGYKEDSVVIRGKEYGEFIRDPHWIAIVPKSHWWWHLDEVAEGKIKVVLKENGYTVEEFG